MNQQVVSLSSADSEFYARRSGCARGLTIKHVLLEILHTTTPDADIKMTVCTDSDAARGIHRVGRARHLQTRYWWHQRALREGHVVVVRCGTKENPSDLGTKVLEKEALTGCMDKLAIIPEATLKSAIAAILAQVGSANEVMITSIEGNCLKKEEKTMGMMAWKTDMVPAVMIGAVAEGTAVVITLLWHAAMSMCGVCGQQTLAEKRDAEGA